MLPPAAARLQAKLFCRLGKTFESMLADMFEKNGGDVFIVRELSITDWQKKERSCFGLLFAVQFSAWK